MSLPARTPPERSLGVLLAVAPQENTFAYATGLVRSAQAGGIQVYLYLLDDAVHSTSHEQIQDLIDRGVKVMACAFAARKRDIQINDDVTFGGLGLLNDIIANTDRFVGFCS